MRELWPFLVVVGALAAIVGGLTWLGTRVRRRGVGGASLAAIDEIFHPAAHESHYEIRVQAQRAVPIQAREDDPPSSASTASEPSGAGYVTKR